MSKVNKLAEEYSISSEEAQEIVRMVMEGGDPTSIDESSPESTQTHQEQSEDVSELQNVDNQIRDLEDQYLTNEMYRNQSIEDNNTDMFNHTTEQMGQIAASLKELKTSRKKIAAEHEDIFGDQEDEDLTREISEDIDREGDIDDEVKGEAVSYAVELLNDPSNNMTKEEAEDVARFRVNRPLNAARAYAFVRNLKEPLSCPTCSSKVARADNPNYMKCEKGHYSEIKVDKVANEILDAPQEERPEEESVGGSLNLSEHEKGRFRDLITQSQGAGPFYFLGSIDGFFGAQFFGDLPASEEELQDYTTGSREGERSQGGVSS